MLRFKVNKDNGWYLITFSEINDGIWKGRVEKSTKKELKDIPMLKFRRPNIWFGNFEKFMNFSLNDLYDNPNWWCLSKHARKSLIGQLIKGDEYARVSACKFLTEAKVLKDGNVLPYKFLPNKVILYQNELVSLRTFIHLEIGRKRIDDEYLPKVIEVGGKKFYFFLNVSEDEKYIVGYREPCSSFSYHEEKDSNLHMALIRLYKFLVDNKLI